MLDLTALKPFLEILGAGALTSTLIFILYGGAKKEAWWVFGWQYREAISVRDKRIEEIAKERDETIQRLSEEYSDRLREALEERNAYRSLVYKTTDVAETVMRRDQR